MEKGGFLPDTGDFAAEAAFNKAVGLYRGKGFRDRETFFAGSGCVTLVFPLKICRKEKDDQPLFLVPWPGEKGRRRGGKELIVVAMDLKITLGIQTGGADFRSGSAHDNMTAVAALPHLHFASFRSRAR